MNTNNGWRGSARELGLEAMEPLVGKNTEDLMNEYIANGFQAIVVSAQSNLIEKEWIGKPVDRHFIEHLKKKPEIDAMRGKRGIPHPSCRLSHV